MERSVSLSEVNLWPISCAVAKVGQAICRPILHTCLCPPFFSCEAVVAETCFLLKRSDFDPSLALQLIDRGVVQFPFVLQEQIGAVKSLFKRFENVPASLADAALIRRAEINASPLLLTTDRDVHIYRRHGRRTIPLVST